MSSDPKIAPQTLAGIERLSQAGRALLDSGEPARAIAEREAALKLVPEPRWVYAAAMKIHATIGDAELALGRLERARDAFGSAAGSAEAAANPYVHLRYGQVLHALGERGAVDALAGWALDGNSLPPPFSLEMLLQLSKAAVDPFLRALPRAASDT
jgi:tetratricopeptide (TPR) repeat protein